MRQTLKNVSRLIALQLITVTLVAIAWGVNNSNAALAAMLGGVIAILPTIIFALRFFSKLHERTPRQILNSFYLGEMFKMIVSVSLLVLVVCEFSVKILPLFSGFLGAYLGLWLTPLLAGRELKRAMTR